MVEVPERKFDPQWIGNDDWWTFVTGIAYLGGRLDFIPKDTLAHFEALGDVKPTTCRYLGALVTDAHDSFLELCRAARSPAGVRSARVGRNALCACGSGKKFKRCCIDRGPAPTPR